MDTKTRLKRVKATMGMGTKTIWPKIIKRADLPGVTPHTLRHTMGATATSSGEALALTGAILGHSNMRSTMIYAHVEQDPARKAANRVGRKIAAALSGKTAIKAGTARQASIGPKTARAG